MAWGGYQEGGNFGHYNVINPSGYGITHFAFYIHFCAKWKNVSGWTKEKWTAFAGDQAMDTPLRSEVMWINLDIYGHYLRGLERKD